MEMRGIKPMMPAAGTDSPGNMGAIQGKLQRLQAELKGLEQKKELTREEKQKKQELEGEIARLQQQMQRTEKEQRKKSGENGKTQEKQIERTGNPVIGERFQKGPEEKDKGRNVDEYI